MSPESIGDEPMMEPVGAAQVALSALSGEGGYEQGAKKGNRGSKRSRPREGRYFLRAFLRISRTTTSAPFFLLMTHSFGLMIIPRSVH